MTRDWCLVHDAYDPGREGRHEALCTLANGYIAVRGASPDARADDIHYPGTYLAGGYNRLTSRVAGREIENEDLVNLPNWLALTFSIDEGAWFHIDAVELLAYRQELDTKRGLLTRSLRFRDADGRTTRWDERRFVSMDNPHLGALEVRLTAEDWSGRVTLRSALDGGVVNAGVARYRGLADRHLETLAARAHGPDAIFLLARTSQSRIHVAEAARTALFRDGQALETAREVDGDGDEIADRRGFALGRGETVAIEKIVAIHTSRDKAISEPGLEAAATLAEAGRFEALLDRHALAWAHLWEDSNIDLAEADAANGTAGKLRVNIFHLLQTVSRHTADLDIGVPARGWTGEAYRGHIFWDEVFIFPFLNLRQPMLTRALLMYRYRRLREARRAARAAGHAGAMYPWQSASNGREETQTLHLNPRSGRWIPDNSHRQRHINSAIAYNVWTYFQATDDHEFLYAHGAEMILEIARFWASVATYNPAIDRYEITGVMGPDEYHTAYPDADPRTGGGLDNNAYTNVMAAWVLDRARDVVDRLPKAHCRRLCESIGLDQGEFEKWVEIGRKMRVPFHDDGIISQFDGYADLEEFDWAGYEARYGDIQRLDRILEAEGDSVNRYKVSKQADVLMLFYLFSADELGILFEQLGYPFERDTIPRTIDYYLSRTSHGSTLSRVVHSWVLARADRPRSWHLFRHALESDLTDIQGGTTPEGIHTGAMAGAVDLVQRCYIGIETRANALHFNPALPDDLKSIRATVRYRRQMLEVAASHDALRIASRPFTAAPITIAYRGHYRDVAPGETYEFPLLKPGERDRDENRWPDAPRAERAGGGGRP